ncbi:helix-turn-helix domain-containing protein [Trinickia acidisoli]|uniref:helix-turn-helix domain-containing protein n=1 Tax=Trinickia acidisoli TaxID=2767482 RepID=UPI001F5DB0FB|nr:helix-turn-helix domain-containing protein [Trinickia acidisoli]
MLGSGLKPLAIAAQLGVSAQSVYNWSHAWCKRGVCGLMGVHNGGRHALLGDDQIAAALQDRNAG